VEGGGRRKQQQAEEKECAGGDGQGMSESAMMNECVGPNERDASSRRERERVCVCVSGNSGVRPCIPRWFGDDGGGRCALYACVGTCGRE
jgi:hypothetical protein